MPSSTPVWKWSDRRSGWRKKWWRWQKPKKEFDEILLEVRRVTRVTTWGRQLAFRAIIIVGNKKGKIWLGVAKWNDVSIAVRKATHEAYKNIIEAPITESLSVPYGITHKYKSALVKIMPASPGTWMKAWSSLRTVLELTGYDNILSKIVWTNNKLNNAVCAIQALSMYKKWKHPERFAKKEAPKSKEASSKTKDIDSKNDKDSKTTAQSWSSGPDKKKPIADSKKSVPASEKKSSPTSSKKTFDLTKIEWIGPKISSLLVEAGITSFAKLAWTDLSVLVTLLQENKLSQHVPTTWPEQAKLASEDKWDELKKRQDELDWWK